MALETNGYDSPFNDHFPGAEAGAPAVGKISHIILVIAAAVAWAGIAVNASAETEGAHYAVCVGVNEYDADYISSKNWLLGCVNDAENISAAIIERGSWEAANVNVLTNSFATKAAIREAITNIAAIAKPGDTFLFTHSSHGYSYPDETGAYTLDTGICAYDDDYEDYELAADLATFASGVKVIVMVDACHSGGLFKEVRRTRGGSILRASAPLREKTAAAAAGFSLAANASAAIDAIRASEPKRRGAKGARITSDEIGWITAAEYDQYSWDDDDGLGGEFTLAVLDGWESGRCDDSGYGDGDGYADFYELWNYAKEIAVGYPEHSEEDATDAQCFNTNVLLSVRAGWVGRHELTDDAAPYIRDIANISIVAGETAQVEVKAFAPAAAPVTSLSIVEGDESATLEDGVFSFTPATAGKYLFTIEAVNANGSGSASFWVTVRLPKPRTPWAENVTSNSFTACWEAVNGADNYALWLGDSEYNRVFSKKVGKVTRYEVDGLEPGELYYFSIRAYSGTTSSAWSDDCIVQMPCAPGWSGMAVPTAQAGRPYVLDFSRALVGWPKPSLELLPCGTAAELDGVLFKWTPDAQGTFDFAVVASNEFGVATNSFAVSAGALAPKKFALCVGINEYMEISGLYGCVNDSLYMRANLIGRGGWESADVTLLTDEQATKAAIRAAMANIAAQAMAGDTFIYQHSSHGGQRSDGSKDVYLCVYDEIFDDDDTAYNDYELAADIAAFPSGVKVAVIVDACHSGGLFKSREAAIAAAKSFDIAGRVSSIMAADRMRRRDSGESIEGSISPEEIGWATAAEYYEYSLDGGCYHTDEWMSNPEYIDEYYDSGADKYYFPDSFKVGGAFLTAGTWGWWKGDADTDAAVGNNDGYCNIYEFWKSGSDFCQTCGDFWGDSEANYNPQCTNTAVLASINLGWSGAAADLADIAADATAEEIAVLLSGGADGALARHVSDAETYGDFKAWAANVKDAGGETPAGTVAVMASAHSWAAFALDSPVLIDEIASRDIEISSFAPAADGTFSLEVGIADAEIGANAKIERLVELFGLKGAYSLKDGEEAFSPDNVTLIADECAKTGDCKVKLVAEPAMETDAFFIRVNID